MVSDQVHEATRDRRCNHVNPCASGAQENLAEEEKFEDGETAWKLID